MTFYILCVSLFLNNIKWISLTISDILLRESLNFTVSVFLLLTLAAKIRHLHTHTLTLLIFCWALAAQLCLSLYFIHQTALTKTQFFIFCFFHLPFIFLFIPPPFQTSMTGMYLVPNMHTGKTQPSRPLEHRWELLQLANSRRLILAPIHLWGPAQHGTARWHPLMKHLERL